jgi:polyisoprenoid-binding protein YceI
VRRALKLLFGALALVVLAAAGFVAWYVYGDRAPAKPKLGSGAPVSGAGPSTPEGSWKLGARPSDFVGYRIKELFGDAVLKRDAVGRTKTVSGTLTIANNRVTTAVVTADISKLDSGRAARDSYARDNAIESSQFPTARFTLTAPIALPAHLARGQRVHTQATGTLLLHGVTHAITITLDTRWNGPTIDAVGTAPIVLRDYKIDAPDTPIAKVDDHGSLELDLEFVPGSG